jgi:hypothetical protein
VIKLSEILGEAEYDQFFNRKTLDKLNQQTKQSRNQFLGDRSLMSLALPNMQNLQQIAQLEQGNTDELEMLAIEIVKSAYPIIDYAGIKIETEISPNTRRANHNMGEPLEQVDDPDFDEVKRRIINGITQGSSIRGTFNYKMYQDHINQINPELADRYDELMKTTFGTFDDDQGLGLARLMKRMPEAEIEGGSVEVTWDENGDHLTIHAFGINFPILVHELVKGVYEVLSLQGFGPDKEKNKQVVKRIDKVENEPEDKRYGKFIYDALSNLYNDSNFDDPRIREYLFTEIYKLPNDQFLLFIENAINDELTSSQRSWAIQAMKDIERDLKQDDAGV